MKLRRLFAARAALAVALALPLTGISSRLDAGETVSFGARDPAAIQCELFTRMDEKGHAGTELQFFTYAQAWFAGRIAENGASGHKPLDSEGAGRERVYRELMEFCEKNPAARFGHALQALWDAPPSP